MRDLLNDLTQQWDALENEPSNTAAWTAFLEKTRDLHERAAIFRYQSLERLKLEEVQKAEEIAKRVEVMEEQPTVVWSPHPTEGPAAGDFRESVDATDEATVPTQVNVSEEEEAYQGVRSAHPPASPANSSLANGPKETLSLAERLSLQPLSAILPALGINDRVRFAGELFGGNMDTLRTACNAAESASDFDSAKKAVTALATSNTDWENEEEAPYQFMQLVQRLHL